MTSRKLVRKSNLSRMFFTAFITSSMIEFGYASADLIDAVIISNKLGSASIAAQGIAYPFFSIACLVSGLLSIGMQIMCSDYIARGKIKEMQQSFSMTTIVSVIIAGLLSIGLFIWADLVAFVLGANGNAAHLMLGAAAYLKGLSVGVVPMILCVVLAGVISLDGGAHLVQVAAIAGAVSDVIFDLVSVKLGGGIFGIGIATSASNLVNFLFLTTHFLKKGRFARFVIKDLPWKDMKNILAMGSERATRSLMDTLRPVFINMIMIAIGGELGMSALSIRNNLCDVIEVPAMGIVGAVGLLTGLTYGEKNWDDCKEVGHLAHVYTLIYSLVVIVVMIPLADIVAGIYVPNDPELRNLVIFAIYCLAVGNVFSTLVVCRVAYLQSIHLIKEPQILTLLNKLIVVLAICLILMKIMGHRGVIVALAACGFIILAGIYIYYVIRYRKLKPSVDDFMNLPDEFKIKPQDIIELQIGNMEEAVTVSEQLQLFARGHKLPEEKAYRAAICAEELTKNIIDFGYANVEKHGFIDFRAIISDGDIILRIRDDCHKFDVQQYVSMITEEKPTEGLGLYLVAKESKDIKYVNIMNTNTVMVTI